MKIIQIREEVEFTKLFKTEGDVIIDFYADWCMPCKALSKICDDVSKDEKYKDLTLIKVNIEKFQDIARSYNVRSLPTMVFTKLTPDDRKIIKTKVGSLSKEKLCNLIGDIYEC